MTDADVLKTDDEIDATSLVARALNTLIKLVEDENVPDDLRINAAELILKWDIDSV